MASEATIKQQIENTVKGQYSDWQIGITTDPILRKAQLGNPLNWLHWQADSEQEARNVLQHFLQQGMKQSRKPDTPANYVYILPVHNAN